MLDVPPNPADELAGELRRAFTSGELTAYFQPLYDLKTRHVVALEALCRWNHPAHGLLLPDRFIQVAEHHGLIAELGHVMLVESGRRLAEWHRRGLRVGLSLNVSPTELRREFAETVLDTLARLELPRWAVTIEITESPRLQESHEELETLDALLDGGVGVSIDDFGAGHTSLEILRRLRFTEVKIDRSLMHDDRPATDELVGECVEIAREHEACVVAEGVETAEHFARALRWGCDRAQGFYFAPALPAEQLEPILAEA
ncbi:EAL domain-containing protein [Agromyces aerolatus]|uniref:EAL domain-containing protein n=1 Tax=Agromyces sp. LY-1074 TaxID=3074080 RepID=UPI00285C8EF4|nr:MULTISPECIES: EAL domain-containing protein [unclassified Agromyces]MDR5699274.1 EAL domain-containing protein [Agromyces sp. LY-1074]MDR5705570.1 EAL domain-containing protein [Agromyces sp. LY-1358]